jgi:hypothetical protein
LDLVLGLLPEAVPPDALTQVMVKEETSEEVVVAVTAVHLAWWAAALA